MSRAKWTPVDTNALGFTCTRNVVNQQRERKQHIAKRNDTLPIEPAKPVATTTVSYAVCGRCNSKYEIMPGCPLLDPKVQQARADEYEYYSDSFFLNPNTECRKCSFGWEMSGWCIIEDSVDDDNDPELIEYKKDELAKYYKGIADGRALRAYLKAV